MNPADAETRGRISSRLGSAALWSSGTNLVQRSLVHEEALAFGAVVVIRLGTAVSVQSLHMRKVSIAFGAQDHFWWGKERTPAGSTQLRTKARYTVSMLGMVPAKLMLSLETDPAPQSPHF